MRVEAVSKRYGRGRPVLTEVSLDVPAGEPVVVHGANGSGKSTLLRIVAGAAVPTSGRVTGRPRIVGYVPDRFPSSLRLSAAAYLRHLAAIRGVPRRDAMHRASALLDELGFNGGSGTSMSRLSKGNAQKVALAQALGCEPELLVLDEPWAGLDADAALALDVRLGAAAEAGVAMVLADHTGRAPRLPAVRSVWLDGGRLTDRPRIGLVAIELSCAGDPDAVLRALPVDGAGGSVTPGRISLVVPADRSDAVLAAALGAGCGVRGVRELTEAGP